MAKFHSASPREITSPFTHEIISISHSKACNWRASEASETLPQVCSIENRGYIIYIILGMCSFQHKWASERQLYLFVLLHHVIMK